MKKEIKTKISGIITLILILIVAVKFGMKIFKEFKPKDNRLKPPTIEEIDKETLDVLGAIKVSADSLISLDSGLTFKQPADYFYLTNMISDTLIVISKYEYLTLAIHTLDSTNTDITKAWEDLRRSYAKNQKFSFVGYPDEEKNGYKILTKEYYLENPVMTTVGIAKLLTFNGKYYFFQCETNFMTDNRFQSFASNLLNNAIEINK